VSSVHTGGMLELDDFALDEELSIPELSAGSLELDDRTLLEDFALLDILTMLEDSGLNEPEDHPFVELEDLALLELDVAFLDEDVVPSCSTGPVPELLSPQAENVSPNRADMVKAVASFLICIGAPLGLCLSILK